jgi:hypothetical protein
MLRQGGRFWMPDTAAPDVNIQTLQTMYEEGGVVAYIFDYFASRHKGSSVTKTDRLLQILYQQGQAISRSEAIQFLRALEEAGCGRYVEGRRGHVSRFEWFVNLIAVGEAAAGTQPTTGQMFEPDDLDNVDEDLLRHEYRLRPELVVCLDLPHDLTPSEAGRLAEYIKTLPFC